MSPKAYSSTQNIEKEEIEEEAEEGTLNARSEGLKRLRESTKGDCINRNLGPLKQEFKPKKKVGPSTKLRP